MATSIGLQRIETIAAAKARVATRGWLRSSGARDFKFTRPPTSAAKLQLHTDRLQISGSLTTTARSAFPSPEPSEIESPGACPFFQRSQHVFRLGDWCRFCASDGTRYGDRDRLRCLLSASIAAAAHRPPRLSFASWDRFAEFDTAGTFV